MSSYGEEKKRDMARSILPSTARRGARNDLSHVKRAARSNVRLRLHKFKGNAAEAVETYLDDADDLEFYPNRRIKEIVWDRRASDKVAPVMRWAVAITKDVPLESRLSAFRSLMPNNTIGRHAVQHVEWMDEFSDPNDFSYGRYRRRFSEEELAEAEWVRNAMIAVLVERINMLFEKKDALKRFNKSAVANMTVRKSIPHKKYAEDYGVPSYKVYYDRTRNEWYYFVLVHRPLRGKHDVLDFLRDFRVNRSEVWGRERWEVLDNVLKDLGI